MSDNSQFSEREKEVTELLLQGKSNKQIALALGISASTVEYHLKNVYKKLQVSSRTEAVLRLGKSIGSNVMSELGKSTVEMNGETADNGVQPISTRRIPMNKMFAIIGGGLLTIALVVVLVLVNKSAQSTEVAPTAQARLTPTQILIPTLTQTDFSISTPAITETSIPPFEYIVTPDDTCTSIATAFNISVEVIMDINNLSSSCILTSGQTLLIPSASSTQDILLYFSRANSDTLPLQPFQLTPIPEITTPEPNSILNANLTINEIEKGVGFDVLEPTWLSDILSFKGANYDSNNKTAYLFYLLKDSGTTNGIVLREQQIKLIDECDLCGVIGASALVEKIQFGNDTGEYVEGVWNLTDNGPIWDPTPYLRTLRWQSKGMAFELLSMCPPDSISKSDIIRLAESLK